MLRDAVPCAVLNNLASTLYKDRQPGYIQENKERLLYHSPTEYSIHS